MAQPRRSRPDRWCEVDVAPSAPNSRPQVVHTRWGILRRKIASHAVYPHRHQNAGAAPGHGVGGVVADGSMTGDDEALAAPLSVLGLSIRASNALLNNGFSTVGDVVAKTECRATIKVRKPDNQDEKVVALLVSQGGRSPTGGASSATISLSFL